MSRDGHDDDTVLAVVREYARGQARRFAGRPQRGVPARGARFGATGNPGGRVPTPPRDPKDNKCAICNQVGHTKENCPKPQIAMEERKCHICNETGHIARICPDRERPAGKPALMAQQAPGTAIVPYRNATFLGVIIDNEGFQQPRRPRPRQETFDELPVAHREATQKLRNSKFAALIDDEEDGTAADASALTGASASGSA